MEREKAIFAIDAANWRNALEELFGKYGGKFDLSKTRMVISKKIQEKRNIETVIMHSYYVDKEITLSTLTTFHTTLENKLGYQLIVPEETQPEGSKWDDERIQEILTDLTKENIEEQKIIKDNIKDIKTIIIGSGDGDYRDYLQNLKALGFYIVIVNIPIQTSTMYFHELADLFIDFWDIKDECKLDDKADKNGYHKNPLQSEIPIMVEEKMIKTEMNTVLLIPENKYDEVIDDYSLMEKKWRKNKDIKQIDSKVRKFY